MIWNIPVLKKFLFGTSGSTAIEYAIVAGMISIAIVVGVTNLGSNTSELYDDVDKKISAAQ